MQSSKYKILVVEDEADIRMLVRTLLETAGYQVITAENGETGKLLQASHQPDLVLLDVGLPDKDGRTVLASIRTHSAVPIIILSAHDEENVIVEALDLGANDYVRKPFNAPELIARVRNTLRMTHAATPSESAFVQGKLRIDFDARAVILDAHEIHLTQTEFNILALLAKHCGKMLTYSFICKSIWGYTDDGSTKKLQVNMANIRKKFSAFPDGTRYIQNELGVGYRMRDRGETK